MPPLTIGTLTLDLPLLLAPMAGITDAAFRSICADFGAAMTFTEVTSAPGIVHGSRRTLDLLCTLDNEGPVVAHLFGSDPDSLACAAATAEATRRFAMVDINAGCPVRRIVSKGSGAALMGDPDHLATIVRAVRSAVTIPLTVKTRLGLSPDRHNIERLTDAVAVAGADAVIVHARYASQRHSGPAHWGRLTELVRRSPIPVVGNGGVCSAGDAIAIREMTGVAGVMVGRGAWGTPWVFRDIVAALRGDAPFPAPTDRELRQLMETHLDRLLRQKQMEHPRGRPPHPTPEQATCLAFRPHLLKYLGGRPRSGDVRKQLNALRELDDVRRAIAHVLG